MRFASVSRIVSASPASSVPQHLLRGLATGNNSFRHCPATAGFYCYQTFSPASLSAEPGHFYPCFKSGSLFAACLFAPHCFRQHQRRERSYRNGNEQRTEVSSPVSGFSQDYLNTISIEFSNP